MAGHCGLIRHFYHLENDFNNVIKHPHLDLIPTNTREEFIEKNRDKICKDMGEGNAVKVIDGFKSN